MHTAFRRLLLLLLLLPAAGGASPTGVTAGDEQAVRDLLAAQAEAWNRGDIPGFMAAYARSDRLRFASGGSITHGWQPTLDRYRQRYPDRATMGALAFELHEVEVLAPGVALVFGRWQLTRGPDRPWGLFTLVLRRLPEGWRIVSDHTSSAD